MSAVLLFLYDFGTTIMTKSSFVMGYNSLYIPNFGMRRKVWKRRKTVCSTNYVLSLRSG